MAIVASKDQQAIGAQKEKPRRKLKTRKEAEERPELIRVRLIGVRRHWKNLKLKKLKC